MKPGNALEAVLRREHLAISVLMLALFVLAVLYTVLGVGMDMSALEMTNMSGQSAPMRGMGQMGDMEGGRSAFYWLLVFLMWWVMMAAMMLPSVAPTILLHAAMLRHASGPAAHLPVSAGFLAGYLAIWGVFSLAATLAQWALQTGNFMSASMMTLTSSPLGGGVLLAAGVYQLSGLKRACLKHCQTPVEFLTKRRRPGWNGAFVMGIEHGLFCLGCCWGLMILLFVGGVMNLYWIVGLAVVVALEKKLRTGPLIASAVGVLLSVWGIYVLAGAFAG